MNNSQKYLNTLIIAIALMALYPFNSVSAQTNTPSPIPTPAPFDVLWDFRISTQGFSAYSNRAIWSDGNGWAINPDCASLDNCGSVIQIQSFAFDPDASITIDTVRFVMSRPLDAICTYEFANGDPHTSSLDRVDTDCGATHEMTGLDIVSSSIWFGAGAENNTPGGTVYSGYLQSIEIIGHAIIPPPSTVIPTTSPIPCGGALCIAVGTFYPPCTATPSGSPTVTPTLQSVIATHVFPTVQLMTPITFPTIATSATHTPGPSVTPFSTNPPTATFINTPTASATSPCNLPLTSTPIVGYGEHDIPGGACFRFTPAISINTDALTVFGTELVPAIHIIAHPFDFCYTEFKLDVTIADIDLWSWLIIIFDLWLIAWVINILRANG